jgi:cytochrome P450 family 144
VASTPSAADRAPLYSSDPAELLALAVNEDPHSFFARVRERHGIARVGETGVHLVATWDLIEEALEREQDFSANLTGVLVRGEDGLPHPFPLPIAEASQVIATADEPAHAVHRALAQPRLAATRIAEMEPALRAWAVSALEPWLAEGGGDYVPLAEIVPARVVAHVLGLPEGDVDLFRQWAMMGGDMLAGDVSAEQMHAYAVETGHTIAYLQKHLDAARGLGPPGPDAPLLRALAHGVDSDRIARDAAIGIAMVMFGAGGESTAALIGSAALRLAQDPALADHLRSHPDRIARFVEEVVRLDPPFKFHYRAVRRSCSLGSARLEPGDRLMLVWAAANRDPAHFEDPDQLRLDRRHPKQHMGFGRGAHFCIGAPIARLEGRVMMEELLARTRHIALRAGDPPVYARSLLVRRLVRLPLDAA